MDSKGTAFFGRGVSRRRSRFQKLRRDMRSTLRLSQTLRKAAYSDMKKQQIEERLQGANAAWQNMDTDTVCCC